MTRPIPDEVVFSATKLYHDAPSRFERFGAMRQILAAERDRAASIAEEYGRPDIAAKIRGEA